MRSGLLIFCVAFITVCNAATAQDNVTDASGMKQGHWIKRYANGNIQYEGTFRNNIPTGELKRYFEDGHLQSVLTFDQTGREAYAVFMHPDGKKAAEGRYIGKKKEGLWKYYSAITADYQVSEDFFAADIRNGLSRKFYPTGEVAETLSWVNGNKEGAWLQFYADGTACLKATYVNGRLEGAFVFYFPDGKINVEGAYLSDRRNGTWKIYNEDGSLRDEIEYINGKPADPSADEKETRLLDELEKNKGKIVDPEMTGNEQQY